MRLAAGRGCGGWPVRLSEAADESSTDGTKRANDRDGACPLEDAAELLPDEFWRRRTLFEREGIPMDAAVGLALTDAEFGDDGMEGMV